MGLAMCRAAIKGVLMCVYESRIWKFQLPLNICVLGLGWETRVERAEAAGHKWDRDLCYDDGCAGIVFNILFTNCYFF
jgi:hypothetical protein